MGLLSRLLARGARQATRYGERDFERAFGGVYEPPPVLYRGMRQPLEGDLFNAPQTKWDGVWMAEDPAMASNYAQRELGAGVFDEGAAVYPLRARGRFMDAESFTRLRREADSLEALRQRMRELGYVGMHDPSARTWMALDPDAISAALHR